jgi:hypothetical protein
LVEEEKKQRKSQRCSNDEASGGVGLAVALPEED